MTNVSIVRGRFLQTCCEVLGGRKLVVDRQDIEGACGRAKPQAGEDDAREETKKPRRVAGGFVRCCCVSAISLLKNAIVAFFNLAKRRAKLATARKNERFFKRSF